MLERGSIHEKTTDLEVVIDIGSSDLTSLSPRQALSFEYLVNLNARGQSVTLLRGERTCLAAGRNFRPETCRKN